MRPLPSAVPNVAMNRVDFIQGDLAFVPET
jgi:hypothetical protein